MYATEMKYIFDLSNATGGVDADCTAAKHPKDQWQCMFAPDAYAFTSSPTFPINSALDKWQTACIYTAELPTHFPSQPVAAWFQNQLAGCAKLSGWSRCAGYLLGNPENCDQAQIKAMNQYIRDFMHTVNSTKTYTRVGNGGFFHSCHTHCEAQSGSFWDLKIGGVSLGGALARWWQSNGTDKAEQHTYLPCEYHDGPEGKRACNPTCPH